MLKVDAKLVYIIDVCKITYIYFSIKVRFFYHRNWMQIR